jgi:hypothetical protein
MIKRAKTNPAFPGKIEVWSWGNSHGYMKPRILRIGFSGSWAEPYSSLHLYIWKIDVWFVRNPVRKLMDVWREMKIDLTLRRQGVRCPECGSYRLREGNGMAYEPIVYCKSCGKIIWEADPEPYII